MTAFHDRQPFYLECHFSCTTARIVNTWPYFASYVPRALTSVGSALRVKLTAWHPASGKTLINGHNLVVPRCEVIPAVAALPCPSHFLVVRERSKFQELNRRAVVNDHRHCHTWRGTVRFNQDLLTFEGPGKVVDLKRNVR